MQRALAVLLLVVAATAGSPVRTTRETDVTAYDGDQEAVIVLEVEDTDEDEKEKVENEQSGPSQLPLVTLEVLKHLEELPPSERISELGGMWNKLDFVPPSELKSRIQQQEKWWACNWTFSLPQTVINFYQILPNALDRPVSATDLLNYGY